MTDRNPIPLDAFEAAIEPLDADEFASLVGAIRSETADAIEIEPPFVRVRTNDDGTDVLVEPAATDAELSATDEFDAVAVPTDDPPDGTGDATVITPADLRERLLYAMPAAEADAVCDRFLDAPARSPSYPAIGDGSAPGAAGGATEDERSADADHGDDGTEGRSGGGSGAGGVASGDVASGGVASGDVASGGIGSGSVGSGGVDAAGAPSPVGSGRGGSGRSSSEQFPSTRAQGDDPGRSAATRSPAAEESETGTEPDRSVGRLAVIAVLVVLLSTVAGAAYLTDGTGEGGTSGLLGFGDEASVDPQERDDALATNENRTNVPDEDDGDESDADVGSGGSGGTAGENESNLSTVANADEVARNTGLRPTCERSALQVVQVQMNAFRYNDNETNDGIRTARRFASPQNRRAVGSLEEFVGLFDTPRYAPMLSYDTAEYSLPSIEDDRATVRVVTRENGSVTGRYEFRLTKVLGGSGATDDGVDDAVDGCWMTNAVSASDTG